MNTSQKSIVVGYDGSDLADLALDWAAATANLTHARVEVIIAFGRGSELVSWALSGEDRLDAIAQIVARAEQRIHDLKLTDAKVEQVQGDPVTVLCEAGEHARMVVVGAVGHDRLESWLVGSVSRHLAMYAPCTVVVVRSSKHANDRIVVGVEKGPSSAAALRFAVERADLLGAPVVAMHGWRPDRRMRLDPQTGVKPDVSIDDARRLLAEATAGFAEEFPSVGIDVEPIEVVAEQLLRDASQSASLVVVGARGRNGFERLLLGSVSQDVLEHADSTVAIVR